MARAQMTNDIMPLSQCSISSGMRTFIAFDCVTWGLICFTRFATTAMACNSACEQVCKFSNKSSNREPNFFLKANETRKIVQQLEQIEENGDFKEEVLLFLWSKLESKYLFIFRF
jgi:hypothetical protein